tara:strand:+ start:211 stop:441 length:231 start_codon:yes stop_codon:yes gene_type:complete
MKQLHETAEEILSEIAVSTPKSAKLVPFMLKAIDKVDEDLSIKDFAIAVTSIVTNEYGSHLFDEFKNIVRIKLKTK